MKTTWKYWGICALTVVLLAGCASTGGGGGPSDEELIGTLLGSVMESLKAGDVDKMAMSYSEDFTSDQGGKPEMVQFLQGAKEQGFLDGIEVDMANTVITVDDMGKAKAEPVEVSGAFGALSLSFELEKRDGSWIITSQLTSQ